MTPAQAEPNSMHDLTLGGAAPLRCGDRAILIAALAAEVTQS